MTTLVTTPPRRQWSVLRERLWLLQELMRRPVGFLTVMVVLLIVGIAIFAPYIAPYAPDKIDPVHSFAAPSAAHLLGTDYLGRDLLSRVFFGARTAFEIVIPAVLIGFVAGLVIGLSAGYLGGWFDKVMIVIIDTMLSFPAVILALALLTLLGPSQNNTIMLITIAFTPGYARLSRAQALAIKQQPYVEAERSLGAGTGRVVARHVFPNMVPPLLILMAMDVPGGIGIEAGLAFLGLGVQPPTPDWGVMLNDGFTYVLTEPWPLVGPIIALVVVTAAFTLLGETLRDIMDPKMAGARPQRIRFRGMRKL